MLCWRWDPHLGVAFSGVFWHVGCETYSITWEAPIMATIWMHPRRASRKYWPCCSTAKRHASTCLCSTCVSPLLVALLRYVATSLLCFSLLFPVGPIATTAKIWKATLSTNIKNMIYQRNKTSIIVHYYGCVWLYLCSICVVGQVSRVHGAAAPWERSSYCATSMAQVKSILECAKGPLLNLCVIV